jgi:N-acetyl-alpha-D-glucosaminyl L-malate synthase BshA
MMVGEGPEKAMAEDLVDELNITDKVMFLGQSNEIDKILCFSDLFLLPSEKESFGLSALEAMVNRVAVISTNTGGLPEVNKHGISGYLSNVGDVEDMAKNAIKILENEETLELFKDNAKKVAAKFDIENVVPFYEAIYEKALEVKV